MHTTKKRSALLVAIIFLVTAIAPMTALAADTGSLKLTAEPAGATDPNVGIGAGRDINFIAEGAGSLGSSAAVTAPNASGDGNVAQTIVTRSDSDEDYDWTGALALRLSPSFDGSAWAVAPTVRQDTTFLVGVASGDATALARIYVKGAERTFLGAVNPPDTQGSGYADDPFIVDVQTGQTVEIGYTSSSGQTSFASWHVHNYTIGYLKGEDKIDLSEVFDGWPTGSYLIDVTDVATIDGEQVGECIYWQVNYQAAPESEVVTPVEGSDLTISGQYIEGESLSSNPGGVQVDAFLNDLDVRAEYETEVIGTSYHGSGIPGTSAIGTGMKVRAQHEFTEDGATHTVDLTVVVKGDVTGSGRMDFTQLVAMAGGFAGTRLLSTAQFMAADLDGSGVITLTDVVQEANLYLALR